jgi:hypothetical protein
MSAIPVAIPRAEGWRRTNRSVDHLALPARSTQPCPIVRAPNRQAWRLTDRGIAVVMVIAAMILTAALIVIGLTVARVTEPDYRPGFEEWTQTQK